MLVRSADASRSDSEWKGFLRSHDFGQLIVSSPAHNLPIVVPLHFVYDGENEIMCHLARPNPIWEALESRGEAMLSVIGAYTYVTSAWNTPPGESLEFGIPTSYYAVVQVRGRTRIVDDPDGIANILNQQLAHFEPDGPTAQVTRSNEYAKFLGAIRGIQLRVDEVEAKFKFGGNRSGDHQKTISDALRERGGPLDTEASDIQLRRLSETSQKLAGTPQHRKL